MRFGRREMERRYLENADHPVLIAPVQDAPVGIKLMKFGFARGNRRHDRCVGEIRMDRRFDACIRTRKNNRRGEEQRTKGGGCRELLYVHLDTLQNFSGWSGLHLWINCWQLAT